MPSHGFGVLLLSAARVLAFLALVGASWMSVATQAQAALVDYVITFNQTGGADTAGIGVGMSTGTFKANDTVESTVSAFSAVATDVATFGAINWVIGSGDTGTYDAFPDTKPFPALDGILNSVDAGTTFQLIIDPAGFWRIQSFVTEEDEPTNQGDGTYTTSVALAPAVVPLPPALLLFGSGLVALFGWLGIGRRRQMA